MLVKNSGICTSKKREKGISMLVGGTVSIIRVNASKVFVMINITEEERLRL
jgi:hypothetical protein